MQDYTVISLDNFRQKFAKFRSDKSQNSKVVHLAKEELKALLHSHSKIVWDTTNLRRDFRQQVISLSRKYGALVTLVIFQCSEATYFQRNQERENPIPENVLIKQLQNMEFPEFDEGDRIIVVDKIGTTLAQYGIC